MTNDNAQAYVRMLTARAAKLRREATKQFKAGDREGAERKRFGAVCISEAVSDFRKFNSSR